MTSKMFGKICLSKVSDLRYLWSDPYNLDQNVNDSYDLILQNLFLRVDSILGFVSLEKVSVGPPTSLEKQRG